MIYAAVAAFAWVLFAPFVGPEDTHRLNDEVRFAVADMQPGDVELVNWAGKPLIIARRTDQWEMQLTTANSARLKDASSRDSAQPPAMSNPLRSIESGWFVAVGLGTGSGCAVQYKEPSSVVISGARWPGGFIDGCDQSRYDLAGRVLVGQAARKNLVVPEWRLDGAEIILLPQ